MKTTTILKRSVRLICIALWCGYALSQPFSNNFNFAISDQGNGNGDGLIGLFGSVKELRVLPDQKILLMGDFEYYNGYPCKQILRLNANGTQDFGLDIGTGYQGGYLKAIRVFNDGSYLIAGNATSYNGQLINLLTKILPDGYLDSDFTVSGIFGTMNQLELDKNNKILLSGEFTDTGGQNLSGLIRIQTNGYIDNSFNAGNTGNSGGQNNGAIQRIRVQADGKILIGGYFDSYNGTSANRLARLNQDGTLDTNFHLGSAFFENDAYVQDIAIAPDGKIWVAGKFSTYDNVQANNLILLNADGSPASGYNSGTGFNNVVNALLLDSANNLLAGGSFTEYNGQVAQRVAMIAEDGTMAPQFQVASAANGEVLCLAERNGGEYIVGGKFKRYQEYGASMLARVLSNGEVKTDFNTGTGINGEIMSMLIDDQSRIVISGNFTKSGQESRNNIARLLADGALDLSFDCGTGFDNVVIAVEKQSDGKILAGGIFKHYQGEAVSGCIRLNEDGSRDTGFNPPLWDSVLIQRIVLQPDGKILLGGMFTLDGVNYYRLCRMMQDGSLDPNFQLLPLQSTTEHWSYAASAICLLDDGKIMIGTSRDDGSPIRYFARLNADGTHDTGFSVGLGPDGAVIRIVKDHQNRLLLGGFFTKVDGAQFPSLCRYDLNGNLDNTFQLIQGGNYVVDLLPDTAGNIIVVGLFDQFEGYSVKGICRLFSNGHFDPLFHNSGGAEHYYNISSGVRKIVPYEGGYLVVGNFTKFLGQGHNRITHLIRVSSNPELESKQPKLAYPNPSKGMIQLENQTGYHSKGKLYSTNGELLTYPECTWDGKLNLEDYPDGTYFYEISRQNQIQVYRIVLQR